MSLLFVLAFVAAPPSDDWDVARPTVRLDAADTLSPAVNIKDNTVTLSNRGTLRSKRDYPQGGLVSTTWKWTKGVTAEKYHDHLIVVFFSNAKQNGWPFEVTDGIHVRFNPGAEAITIEQWAEGKDAVILARKDAITFDKGKTYKLNIEATPVKITVSVDKQKVLDARLPGTPAGKRIAIYNREPVAGVEKQSVLSDLTIHQAGDPLDEVYRAMRISEAHLSAAVVKRGEKTTIRYSLQNQSKRPIAVPKPDGHQLRTVGGRQHWIERLGEDHTIAVIPDRVTRDGRRYAAGGSLILANETLDAGEKLPFEVMVDTKGFARGRYRYCIQYRKYGGQQDIIQEWSVEFEVQ